MPGRSRMLRLCWVESCVAKNIQEQHGAEPAQHIGVSEEARIKTLSRMLTIGPKSQHMSHFSHPYRPYTHDILATMSEHIF